MGGPRQGPIRDGGGRPGWPRGQLEAIAAREADPSAGRAGGGRGARSPWECSEMALPRNWLNSFSPMALRTTITSGAKMPPSLVLPIRVTARWPADQQTTYGASRPHEAARGPEAAAGDRDRRIGVRGRARGGRWAVEGAGRAATTGPGRGRVCARSGARRSRVSPRPFVLGSATRVPVAKLHDTDDMARLWLDCSGSVRDEWTDRRVRLKSRWVDTVAVLDAREVSESPFSPPRPGLTLSQNSQSQTIRLQPIALPTSHTALLTTGS